MNNFFKDPTDPGPDVIDLLAKAGPPPEQKVVNLLFSPRVDEVLRSVAEWNKQWRAHLDNSYYFRRDVADKIFEFDGVMCSIVKNGQWMEALETRNWSKHEIYGYNGYALFKQVPYLFDGITGSLEEEVVFAREVEAYGGIDLAHLDEHGWLCSFIVSHDWDWDNPGRTDKLWVKEQIIKMVASVNAQIRAPRVPRADMDEGEIGRSKNVAWNIIGPREAFGVPCYWTDEVTGELAPAVRAYLQGKQLSSKYVGALRTYFQQWIQSRVWDMNTHATIESRRAVGKLRNSVETIQSASDVNHWLGAAIRLGLSPLG
jgi:hypothetical protein